MKSIVKHSCIFLLAFCAGGALLLGQPSTTDTTNKPASATPRLVKRFTGSIASVDAQAHTFIVDSSPADKILATPDTQITKDRKPATFADLAAGQRVTGNKHQDAAGTWVAGAVSVAVPKAPTADPKVQ